MGGLAAPALAACHGDSPAGGGLLVVVGFGQRPLGTKRWATGETEARGGSVRFLSWET